MIPHMEDQQGLRLSFVCMVLHAWPGQTVHSTARAQWQGNRSAAPDFGFNGPHAGPLFHAPSPVLPDH
jgi:hypothetical protein